jgi:glyoxylase I family protein
MSHRCTVNGFHHAALKVANFDAVVEFYKKGLGVAEKIAWGEGDGRAVLLDCGNGNYLEVFAGGGSSGSVPDGAVLHLALRTDDCDAALAQAVAAGAAVTMAPRDVTIPSTPQPTPVRIAFCRGLAGETLEFFQNAAT